MQTASAVGRGSTRDVAEGMAGSGGRPPRTVAHCLFQEATIMELWKGCILTHCVGFATLLQPPTRPLFTWWLEQRQAPILNFSLRRPELPPCRHSPSPRLELLSALLLARLIATVSLVLEPAFSDLKIECYTDSTVALYWIRGASKEWKPFVQNRVHEIVKKIPPDKWNHCPGVTNPADLPSRGMSMCELRVSRLWRFGPDWQNSGTISDDLAGMTEGAKMPEECCDELKARVKKVHNLATNEVEPTIGDLLKCEKFSSFRRLVRVTAYVMRAVKLFKNRMVAKGTTSLSTEELTDAELKWIKDAQVTLSHEKLFQSLKSQLNLFLDENGLWRCGGRLANADLLYCTKYPILLPRNHLLTPLIVNDAHRRCITQWCTRNTDRCQKEVLDCERAKSGPGNNSSLRHLSQVEGIPFPAPPPPPLPVCRVKDDPAFSFTGVDFAGPLLIRTERS